MSDERSFTELTDPGIARAADAFRAANMEMQTIGETMLMSPLTGEVIERTDKPGLARLITEARVAKQHLNNLVDDITSAVAELVALEGTHTLLAGDHKLVLSPDHETVYDAGRLLESLREAGCPEARLDALVTQTVSYKVNAAVCKQLASANPLYGGIIQACSDSRPVKPRVSVK